MKKVPELIFPDWTAPDNVRAFSTTRRGGVSLPPYHGASLSDGGLNLAVHVGDDERHVRENRDRVRKWLPDEPLWLNQVHGTVVVRADTACGNPQADASFSSGRGKVCAVQTADCLPVLFCDTNGSVVAAAHAGWRGLAKGVLQETLSQMRLSGAGEILAWLGPAIGPTRFEVGEDVRDAFVSRYSGLDHCFAPRSGLQGKYLADLYAMARLILEKEEVRKISGGRFCTASETARFYSHRRDGVTGRMASCIWLT